MLNTKKILRLKENALQKHPKEKKWEITSTIHRFFKILKAVLHETEFVMIRVIKTIDENVSLRGTFVDEGQVIKCIEGFVGEGQVR